VTSATTVRCAAHPARPAHDCCPTCDRPRCARDARRGERCELCLPRPTGRPARPLPVALTAAAVAALPTALLGAALGQEYVGARFFSVVFPALVGVALALAVMSAAGPVRPAGRAVLAALTAGYAAISALLDFRFTDLPYGGPGRWLPPVLAAVVAAVVAAVGFARPAQEWKTSSAIPPR
jgi:hypothetical protein